MVLGIGLISALIIAKKSPKYLTRLQKLQKKLKDKPLNEVTLYEIPVKKIFLIFIIICFMYFLEYFKNMYRRDLQEHDTKISQENEQLKVYKIIYWLKIVYSIFIMCLMSSISWKTVKV